MKIGSFPDLVSENGARLVATFVWVLGIFSILFPESYAVVLLTLGFLARTLYGPKYSLAAKISLDYIIPKFGLSKRQVPGPPKRFAQFIGLVFTITATVFLLLNYILEYKIVLSILVFFALLESFLNFCAGCFVFGIFMKLGIIPDDVCERCNNINYGENI